MSDLEMRRAHGEAARQAYEQFVAPALAALRADYMGKLTEEAVKPMEGRALQVVQNLSLALRVAKEVENQLKSAILDGDLAANELSRAADLGRLGPEARRYASY